MSAADFMMWGKDETDNRIFYGMGEFLRHPMSLEVVG